MLTVPKLARACDCTLARASTWLEPLSVAMATFDIVGAKRQAAFFAQIAHESGRLQYTTELWGPTDAQKRYEGRTDLGNVQPGDGFRYRGRGLIQTTGRWNFARARDGLRKHIPGAPDFEAQPEALAMPRWAAMSAAFYWHDKQLNRWADAGDFDGVCDVVNRGRKTEKVGDSNGYADRLVLWAGAKAALAA